MVACCSTMVQKLTTGRIYNSHSILLPILAKSTRVNAAQVRSIDQSYFFIHPAMEKEQKANSASDNMQIDNEGSNEVVPKRGKQKRLRGSEKTDAELVPNNTGRKQGFVNYAVTYEEDDIFKKMKIASHKPLEDCEGRTKCPLCQGNRKYFCYSCFCIVGMPEDQIPRLELPLQVDILHWPSELTSKATGIHAKILAPNNVQFWEYPNMPEFNYDETLILYPADDAVTMRDMDMSDAKKIKHVVFVDSQWHAAHRILRDERLAKVKCVKITKQKTRFWRYQMCGEECLATIEAIYFFFKEYQECISGGQYNGEYDNLLYYYSFFYNMIQDKYKKSDKKFPRIQNYVKKEDNANNNINTNNTDNINTNNSDNGATQNNSNNHTTGQ